MAVMVMICSRNVFMPPVVEPLQPPRNMRRKKMPEAPGAHNV
jgi:hypothetical protein